MPSRPATAVAALRGGLIELVRPGEGDLSGRQMARYGRMVTTLVIVVTNLIGAGAVLVIALFAIPVPNLGRHTGHIELVNALVTIGYVAFAVPVGVLLGTRRLLALRNWLVEERPATAAEIRLVLYAPVRLFVLQVALWFGGAALFGVLNFTYSAELGVRVVIVVAITGLVTAACAYLLTERILRSAAARVAGPVGRGGRGGGVVAPRPGGRARPPPPPPPPLGITMVVLGGVGIT